MAVQNNSEVTKVEKAICGFIGCGGSATMVGFAAVTCGGLGVANENVCKRFAGNRT